MQKLKLLSSLLILTFLFYSCTKQRIIKDAGNLVPKTVDEDSSIPAILVNGIKLHSEAFGPADSSLIIVLHGGPGADYRYLLNCKEFANNGYRVVFYDQSGAGLSQRLPKSYYNNMDILLNELTGVIEHYKTHNNQKVFLLGHSWGGILATAYMNQYPSKINGMIVAEPGGLVWQDILTYVKKSRKVSIANELLNDQVYLDQFITGKEKEHAILDYKMALLAAADGNSANPIGDESSPAFWRYGAISQMALFELGEKTKPDWTSNLKSYTTNILFLYSENNRAYGIDWAKKQASAYKQAELYLVKGAGHDMLSFETGWNNSYPKMLQYFNSL